MVRMQRYPLAAQTNASPMPVLPDVGSTMTLPGPIVPSASMASIMATPMRSLTLESGLKNSSLASTSAMPWRMWWRIAASACAGVPVARARVSLAW